MVSIHLSERQNFLIIHLQVCRPFLLDQPNHRPINSLPTSCVSAAVVFAAVSPHLHDFLASVLPLPSSFPTLLSSCGIVTESDFFSSWHLHRRKAIRPHYPVPNMADSFPGTLLSARVHGVCCNPHVSGTLCCGKRTLSTGVRVSVALGRWPRPHNTGVCSLLALCSAVSLLSPGRVITAVCAHFERHISMTKRLPESQLSPSCHYNLHLPCLLKSPLGVFIFKVSLFPPLRQKFQASFKLAMAQRWPLCSCRPTCHLPMGRLCLCPRLTQGLESSTH